MMSNVIEQILNTRVEKYCLFEKNDIVRAAGAIGGVDVNVDPIAASRLHIPMGTQKLRQDKLAHFLSPTISGPVESARRQKQVLMDLFEALKNKNIVVTSILAQAIFSSIETNISPADAIAQYSKFSGRSDWKFKELEMPVIAERHENYQAYDPNLDECRKLLSDAAR